MTRVFFAVIAALLVSTGEPRKQATPPPTAQLTAAQLASAPSNVVTLTQGEAVTASVLQPLRACGCTAAPAPFDVMILLGLLAMRALNERSGSSRDRHERSLDLRHREATS